MERDVREVIQEAPPTLIADDRTRTDYYRQFHDLNRADPKIKNIRQTELLVNLRQAILAVRVKWSRDCLHLPLPSISHCFEKQKTYLM